MRSSLATLLAVISFQSGFAQSDTLVNITIPGGSVTFLPVPRSGSAVQGAFTSYSPGETKGLNALMTKPPVFNTMLCAFFTHPWQADKIFNLSDYPSSTAVKLSIFKNDVLTGQCSGHLVAPNLVLSAAHCVSNYRNRLLDCDRVVVTTQDGRVGSPGISYYVLKSWFDDKAKEDMMLLELADPIGNRTGWVGIGFNSGAPFYEQNIFHKFSYPAPKLSLDQTQTPAGARLFYNYGLIDAIDAKMLGIVDSPEALAMPGQSGSAFLVSDEKGFYAVGVAVYSSQYRHYRITQESFGAFQPIITTSISNANSIYFTLFPDPIEHTALLRTSTPLKKFYFVVYDGTGKLVRLQEGEEASLITIQREGLESGQYTFHLSDATGHRARGKFNVK